MIKIGKQAPVWSNVTAYHKGEFHKVSLSDFKGKWLVLFFYPRDFTFICPTELKSFSSEKESFKKLNTEIVACSTDSEWSHKAWFERDLPMVDYSILADTTQALSRDYDVLNEADGSSERGLFVIDPDGVVRYALVSAGSVGRSVKEIIRVVQALQSGELCPVDWVPGGQTLGRAS